MPATLEPTAAPISFAPLSLAADGTEDGTADDTADDTAAALAIVALDSAIRSLPQRRADGQANPHAPADALGIRGERIGLEKAAERLRPDMTADRLAMQAEAFRLLAADIAAGIVTTHREGRESRTIRRGIVGGLMDAAGIIADVLSRF